MLTIRNILHPTDFSATAGHAFRLACSLARDYDAWLCVLHVGSPPIIHPVIGVTPPDPERYRKELEDDLRKLHQAGPELRIERRLMLASDPADQILEVAREMHADLIVMGTHGRTGLDRLLTGSVAERVLRGASCPVLTVKTPLQQTNQSAKPVAGTAGEAAQAEKNDALEAAVTAAVLP